ncbi:P-loop containing nucleoside triphosphate hydrolase protein [Chytriomyces sp. MP71]|nr:P-loop containing nucleoside triphosphate hydrolase protein [Chytriomyces sp. MP71]
MLRKPTWKVPLQLLHGACVERGTLVSRWRSLGEWSLRTLEAWKMLSLFWFHSRTDDFRKLGITPSKGVLLYGPPGTGKTLLAKAVATEAKVNFLSISISAIVKGHVGESEKQISNIFQQAKAASPSIVFLDEIESVFASRESSGDYSQKILAQLVQEIDALSLGSFEAGSADGEPAKVVVLAATNFPALIDPTLLRPGRIDRLIAVRLPTRAQRESILQVYARKNNTASDISWPEWSRKIPGWSGAAIAELFRKARVVAIGADSGESQNLTPVILEKHLHAAWTDLMSSHDSFIPSETAI